MGRTVGWWLFLGMFLGGALAFMAAWVYSRESTTWLAYGLAGGAVVGLLFYRSTR
jgi:uncharacterized membrane protein